MKSSCPVNRGYLSPVIVGLGFLLLLPACIAAQQNITVSDLRDDGVTLTLVPDAPIPSAYLTNNTAKAVLAATVRWSLQAPVTNEIRRYNRTYLLWDLQPILQAFERRMISVNDIGPLQEQRGEASVVALVLDGVTFQDGSTAGRDEAQQRDHIRAKMDATRDLMTTVLAMRNAQVGSQVFAWIKQLLNTPYETRVVPQRTEFSRQRYRRWYFFYQDQEARLLSDIKDTPSYQGT